jgi:hypothetical protein
MTAFAGQQPARFAPRQRWGIGSAPAYDLDLRNQTPGATTVVSGFPRYGNKIASLPPSERAKIDAPHVNSVKMIETSRSLLEGPPDPTGTPIVHVIPRYRKYIEPTAIARDNHPCYWDEPGNISQNVNRHARDTFFPTALRLCDDVTFWDQPSYRLAGAQLGKGVYWNAEVALVGTRRGHKNVSLNTVKCGFDLRPRPTGLGGATERSSSWTKQWLNRLYQVINREICGGNIMTIASLGPAI